MVDPQTFGFEMAAQQGPLTKFVKNTGAGRIVVYETDEVAVRVNEGRDEPSVVVASSGFFWRDDITSGSLRDDQRVSSVETAHAKAQQRVEEAVA